MLVCVVLMLVVLIQQGKGGDLAAAFGGGSSQAAFGARDRRDAADEGHLGVRVAVRDLRAGALDPRSARPRLGGRIGAAAEAGRDAARADTGNATGDAGAGAITEPGTRTTETIKRSTLALAEVAELADAPA